METDIKNLKLQKECLIRQRSELKRELRRSFVYRAFVRRLCELSPGLRDARDVLLRYDNLTFHKQKLLEKERMSQEKMRNLKQEGLAYVEYMKNEILHLNNELLIRKNNSSPWIEGRNEKMNQISEDGKVTKLPDVNDAKVDKPSDVRNIPAMEYMCILQAVIQLMKKKK
ncbi:hypothetical protein HELRODRAFT_175111 [Helobdella robusta]|uniref:DUF4200 domain-containing protein n=1 Tax=Helobdella robusta TaxID=6412 RepID=T1F8V4_HELRO|nr:hypothetical protein HELRODRAFT_175111 [Helobdella robusta]ESO01084.1 hypothetical protein HELRODRAFT_175111 [Helobdella robusta]